MDKLHKPTMQAALAEAPSIIAEIQPEPVMKEAEWGKSRSMEVVELLHERTALLQQQRTVDIAKTENFDEQVCLVSALAGPTVYC